MVEYCSDIDVIVVEVEDLHSDAGFVYAKAEETNFRLSISIRTLQHLFKYACDTGILLPQDDTFYRHSGEIRRFKRAKD